MNSSIFLVLTFFILFAGVSNAGQETPWSDFVSATAGKSDGVNPSDMVMKDTASLIAEPVHKREILDFAKGVLLARLGYGGNPERPVFLAQIQHGCFVTFFSGKRVIACFGSFYPCTGSVAGEIEENVRMALISDSRARSIDRRIAMAADVQVTFPGELRAITSHAEVNPAREGLLVENESGGVAIVPGEAKTASWAFREAMRRLGEKDRSRVRLFKFKACAVSSRK